MFIIGPVSMSEYPNKAIKIKVKLIFGNEDVFPRVYRLASVVFFVTEGRFLMYFIILQLLSIA